jgi:MFS family permease
VEILPLFYIGLIGLGTGQAVLRVVVTSQVAGSAGPLRRGETIGILSAIMSASMVVAPVVAGVLFEIDHVVPYILAIVVLLLGLIELWSGSKRRLEG